MREGGGVGRGLGESDAGGIEVDLGIGKMQGRGLAHVISIFFEMVVTDLTREEKGRIEEINPFLCMK